MNVFFIPSWYPSDTSALPGIFFQDQAYSIGKHFPDANIGISIWGQNDDRLLLWARQPVKTVIKILNKSKLTLSEQSITNKNVTEYFSPTFTWSSKLFHGNMRQIIKANLQNLKKFEDAYGAVDIIHAHVGYPAGYIAKKVSEIHDIPYVITEQMSPFPHRYYITKKGKLNSKLMLVYQGSSRNIAISNALADSMLDFGIQKIIKIPNLVDELFFTPREKSEQDEEFTFFSLGRMVPQKGFDILIKAFAKIKSKAKLRIGGDGENLSNYKQLSQSLGLECKIDWLGELDKNSARIEFQNCDAFVLPSRHESMGVVFAEAMACGKPVIGTICGGPEEFINESNGYLVTPGDEKELAIAMEKMIKNHRHFDSTTIRNQFEKRFSSAVVCRQIMEVYTNVIQFHKGK